jgi:signal transduction histidine kinase/FixJ family two-component response regulator
MLRILHLEDRSEDAVLIEQALRHQDIAAQFTVVRDTTELVAALERQAFDLVLTDSGLPGPDALPALKLVRQRFPALPVICVSGSANQREIDANLRLGATDCVSKDDLGRFVATVRREEEKVNLTRANQGMARLVTAVQELSLAHDLDSIMAIVRRAARELTGADGATFVLRDGDRCHYADENAIAPLWKGQKFPLSTCISGWAMLHRQPAVIEDIYADARIPIDAYRPTFVKSLAMVPIRTEEPIGAIGNYWAHRHLPTADEVKLLQALANTTSVAMENVRIYGELEQRVKDRTAQLEAANAGLEQANQELDSYAHAVSHDLGAPLRSILGFTQLALDECEDGLNETGKGHLHTVQNNAKKMRVLMDDLFRLSQVTRAELKQEKVDLNRLAHEIVAQLKAGSPARNVEVHIAKHLEAKGDRGLLRIVLENLLSNAWKYSSKREQARIDFEKSAQPDGSAVYCVRDNGAGFSMEWAGQLFKPFRRLHRQDEFPGTGIGLTTVQRIIQRHGGRVWAEAQLNRGAAFYFTLPE